MFSGQLCPAADISSTEKTMTMESSAKTHTPEVLVVWGQRSKVPTALVLVDSSAGCCGTIEVDQVVTWAVKAKQILVCRSVVRPCVSLTKRLGRRPCPRLALYGTSRG